MLSPKQDAQATRDVEISRSIVDRGNVIRQGPISELLAGAATTLQVDCSDPDRARELLADINLSVTLATRTDGLAITLPPRARRAMWWPRSHES